MEQAQRAVNAPIAQQNLTKKAGKQSRWVGRKDGRVPQEHAEQLRAGREKAQEANPAKTDFINILTHELRIPIHVIVGCSDLLLDGAWGTLQEEQEAIVVRMKQNACYLLDLISDLMELNRLDGGRGVSRSEEINVNGLLEEMKMMTELLISS